MASREWIGTAVASGLLALCAACRSPVRRYEPPPCLAIVTAVLEQDNDRLLIDALFEAAGGREIELDVAALELGIEWTDVPTRMITNVEGRLEPTSESLAELDSGRYLKLKPGHPKALRFVTTYIGALDEWNWPKQREADWQQRQADRYSLVLGYYVPLTRTRAQLWINESGNPNDEWLMSPPFILEQ